MKGVTRQEYHQAINNVIDFINTHLNEPLDLTTLSGIANLSTFHFHRIFTAFIGESVGMYITRLRLESAAQKLQTTKKTLTEIASLTGYQSQFALSKAFKKHFGVTPSAFRNIQTYFSYQWKKPEPTLLQLSPEIRNEETKHVVYIRIMADYGSPVDYELGWKKLWKFAKQKQIINGKNEYLGLNFDDPNITRSDRCRFYACITTENAIKPEGEFGTMTINNGKYAVFTLKGSYQGLGRLYQAIYLEWLPKSNYHLRNCMPFEKYLNNPDIVTERELLTQIFLPINNN